MNLPRRQAPFSILLATLLFLGPACQPHESQETRELSREVRAALRERSFVKAAELAQRWIGSSPQNHHAWESLIRAQIGAGDFGNAQRTLEEWKSAARKPLKNWDELAGDLASNKGDAPLAIAAWQRGLHAWPKNIRLLHKVAFAHRASQQPEAEDAAWTEALAIEDTGSARIDRALCRRRLHRWPEALEDYRRAQELAADDPDVRRGAKLFERLSKFLPQIREVDARIAMTPEDDQLLADRALLFLRSEDYELALDDSDAAEQKATWAIRPKLFRALALTGLGRGTECADFKVGSGLRLKGLTPEFLETLGRLDSEISLERNNAELYLSRAWQLNEIGQPTLALEDAENAARCDEKSAVAHAEASYALSKLGRTEEALRQIEQATELDANLRVAWHYRGELEMQREDFPTAIESLSRALALEETTDALQKREQCYMKLGLYQKAEEDHRALEILKR